MRLCIIAAAGASAVAKTNRAEPRPSDVLSEVKPQLDWQSWPSELKISCASVMSSCRVAAIGLHCRVVGVTACSGARVRHCPGVTGRRQNPLRTALRGCPIG